MLGGCGTLYQREPDWISLLRLGALGLCLIRMRNSGAVHGVHWQPLVETRCSCTGTWIEQTAWHDCVLALQQRRTVWTRRCGWHGSITQSLLTLNRCGLDRLTSTILATRACMGVEIYSAWSRLRQRRCCSAEYGSTLRYPLMQQRSGLGATGRRLGTSARGAKGFSRRPMQHHVAKMR